MRNRGNLWFVAVIVAIALSAFAGAALAGPYGRPLGYAKASGTSHAVDIGWGARMKRGVSAPRGFTLLVRGALVPGYLCSYSCREAQVHWDVACSKPGYARSLQGGMYGRLPLVGHPRLPFGNARHCTIAVRALPMAYVGGTLKAWLYYRR